MCGYRILGLARLWSVGGYGFVGTSRLELVSGYGSLLEAWPVNGSVVTTWRTEVMKCCRVDQERRPELDQAERVTLACRATEARTHE